MSLTKGQIHKLKGKLSRVDPDSEKAKRIRITLGLEVPEPASEPEPSPVIEVTEVVAEKPKAARPKRTYQRRKTKTTTKE